MTKKKNLYLEKNIEELDVSNEIITILKNNSIDTIEKLWILTRKKLKEFGLKDSDIKLIIIKLQLMGLDLNKKMYS